MNFKEIARLSVTLMLITVLSATVLGFVDDFTAPIIQEQRLGALRDAMFEFFDDADELEVDEADGKEFYAVKNEAGETIGAGTIVTPGGYGGEIEMMVASDNEGTIMGIEILSHAETPGLGDEIEDPEWQEQFRGISLEDDLALGVDVDGISGATVSANAVVQGASGALDMIAFDYFEFEEPETDVDLAEVEDGTYEGEGTGLEPGIIVEVTIEGGELADIEVIDHNDTPNYFEDAWPETGDRMMEEQSLEVEAVSGATLSSEGIMEAALHALLEDEDIEEDEEDETVFRDVDVTQVADGTYQGEATGFKEGLQVEVVVEDGEFLDIDVLKYNDTPEYFEDAWPEVGNRIIENQSTEVEAVSGATNSSEGIMKAVIDALEEEIGEQSQAENDAIEEKNVQNEVLEDSNTSDEIFVENRNKEAKEL